MSEENEIPKKTPVKFKAHEIKETVEVVTHVKWTDFEPVDEKECDEACISGFGFSLSPLEIWRAQKFCEFHKHNDIYGLRGHISIRIEAATSLGSPKYCYCNYCHVEADITDFMDW